MSKTPEGSASVAVRQAAQADAEAMAEVEALAQALLKSQGVDLEVLRIPEEFEPAASWSLAFVAEVGGEVVGMARLTELTREVICLDQVSTSPRFAGRGVGRQVLTEVATACRALGYSAITGTTFRDVASNAPFYTSMGCVEEFDPHPAMVQRRRVEQDLGLDEFGSRLIMRMPL